MHITASNICIEISGGSICSPFSFSHVIFLNWLAAEIKEILLHMTYFPNEKQQQLNIQN